MASDGEWPPSVWVVSLLASLSKLIVVNKGCSASGVVVVACFANESGATYSINRKCLWPLTPSLTIAGQLVCRYMHKQLALSNFVSSTNQTERNETKRNQRADQYGRAR